MRDHPWDRVVPPVRYNNDVIRIRMTMERMQDAFGRFIRTAFPETSARRMIGEPIFDRTSPWWDETVRRCKVVEVISE